MSKRRDVSCKTDKVDIKDYSRVIFWKDILGAAEGKDCRLPTQRPIFQLKQRMPSSLCQSKNMPAAAVNTCVVLFHVTRCSSIHARCIVFVTISINYVSTFLLAPDHHFNSPIFNGVKSSSLVFIVPTKRLVA
ncbi:hypothetical protein RR46_11347 [Papilio xuthus]|uniref:Uncharacterized protein n=1 Tax=Papilio xuthus TaxID=66420 RepID=A0A194PSA3_PAPXU|nr:hypothetical protein RR46_11347 [Papilio xuthus]